MHIPPLYLLDRSSPREGCRLCWVPSRPGYIRLEAVDAEDEPVFSLSVRERHCTFELVEVLSVMLAGDVALSDSVRFMAEKSGLPD